MKTRAIILSMILGIGGLNAATYTWTGGSSSGFFTASNWVDSSTGKAPSSLSAGVPINNDLYIGAGSNIGKDREIKGIINAGSGKVTLKKATLRTDYGTVTGIRSAASLTLDSSIVMVGNLDVPNVVVTGKSELHIYEPEKALTSGTRIDLQGEEAWLFFLTKTPSQVKEKYLSYISIDGVSAKADGNVRVAPYYGGTVIIPHKSSTKALFTYSDKNLTGKEQYFRIGRKTGETLCAGTKEAKSFKLKRGYMAVIAKYASGHAGKAYVADDADVIINLNTNGKDDTIRFVKVVPWKWVCKKGMAGSFNGIGETWNYNWSANDTKYDDKIFVPMRHNKHWPGLAGVVTSTEFTHLLGFNEPDNAADPGQANMTVEEALNLWPMLEETGLILGSPVPVNNGAGKDWLISFMDQALARGYRIDYLCLHNYEKMDPSYFVNNWCKWWYDKYKLPIWVTEYNYGANWNATDADWNNLTTRANYFKNFQGYTDKMDDASFIQRYALYPFYSTNMAPKDSLYCTFEVSPSVLSRPGIWYRDKTSNPESGNPLMFYKKIMDTKAEENPVQVGDAYDRHGFNLLSRRNDGSDRRRVKIATNEGPLFNFAQMGGNSTGTGGATEQFTFVKVGDNQYTLRANNNCLALTVRNDSVLVTQDKALDSQIWAVIEIDGSNKNVALKNKATGKYLAPEGGVISVGTVLRVVELSDINAADTQTRAAHWSLNPMSACDCKPEIENPFVTTVGPLEGGAPLTVTMQGASLDLNGAPAYYRWTIKDGSKESISTRYLDTYKFETPGTYTIDVRGRDFVSTIKYATYTIQVNNVGGVENAEGTKFVISPNPVNDEFTMTGLEGGERVTISNMQGTTVYDGIYRNTAISLGNLSAGIYIVKVDGYDPVKLIKK